MPRIAVACLAVFLSGTAAFAQNAPPPSPHTIPNPPLTAPLPAHSTASLPCIDDINRLCKAERNDVDRRVTCLQTHRTQLVPACRAKLEWFEKRTAAFAAARHETVAQYMAEQAARRRRHAFVPIKGPMPPAHPANTAPAKPAN